MGKVEDIMKKLICILITIVLCLTLSGCSSGPSPRQVGKDILYCFDNDDAEGLKALFCEATLSRTVNIDAEIENAFELYEGKSIDVGSINAASTKSIRDGKTVKETASPCVPVYETDTGKEYVLSATMNIVNKNNPDFVGVSEIRLQVRNDEDELELIATIGNSLH